MADGTRRLKDAHDDASETAAGVVQLAPSGSTAVGLAVQASDARLLDSRPPSGAAGGVLAGTYPSPTFAVDMATQAELNTHAALVSAAGVSGHATKELVDSWIAASTPSGAFAYTNVANVFTDIQTISTAGSEDLRVISTNVNGAALRLTHTGATNPNKYIRSLNGNLQVVNSAYNATLLTITDAGLTGIGISAPTSLLYVFGATPASVGTTPGTNGTQALTVSAAGGGPTTATGTATGGNSGGWNITSAAAGSATAADASSTGGAGGAGSATTGAGGAASVAGTGSNTGGVGGAVSFNTGAGGAATGNTSGANTGGVSGAMVITTGTGGAASGGTGAHQAGAGALLQVVAGTGGSVTGTTGTTWAAGNGGALTVVAGTGGSHQVVNAGTNTGATGGVGTYRGGTGGSASNSTTLNVGGAGGGSSFTSGGGGVANVANAGTNTGGAGGTTSVGAGTGGGAVNSGGPTAIGGAGGTLNVIAGTGGAATLATSNTGGNGGNLDLRGGSGGAGTTAAGAGGNIFLRTSTTTTTAVAVYIDNAQHVGIGAATPATVGVPASGGLEVNSATGGVLTMRRFDTTVTAADMIGKIQFYAADASTITNFIVADIEAQATASVATDINPGRLIFRTTPVDVAGVPVERMRINEDGRIGVGTTSAPSAQLHVSLPSAGLTTYPANSRGIQTSVDVVDTGVTNANEITGFYTITRIQAANTANNTSGSGLSAVIGDVRTVAGATGTVNTVQSFYANAFINDGNTILTAGYGLRINTVTNTGGGSITGYAGVAIAAQTAPTNKTYVLLGTTTIPTGNYTIYSNSGYSSFLAGSLGLGALVPAARLHTVESNQALVPLIERTSTSATARLFGMRQKSTTTVDMTDGFGSGMVFAIQDNAAVENDIAQVAGIRNGADNSGALAFITYLTGTANERARLTSAGAFGVGVTAPTAMLHLPAGTASPNTAPLKFTSSAGVLLATPEPGAMEYDGTDFWHTNAAGRRRVAYTTGIERTMGWYDLTAPAAAAVTGPVYTLRNAATAVGVQAHVITNPSSTATFDIEWWNGSVWATMFSVKPTISTAGVLSAGTLSVTALPAGSKLRRVWTTPAAIADVTVQLDLVTA